MKKSGLNITTFIIISILFVSLIAPTSVQAGTSLSKEGYQLEQVIVLSRHNIRSPMAGKGSYLDSFTPYDWFEWTSGAAELSLRGGVLETEMGQFFRKWLVSEGLIEENYHPQGNEVRIYANSKQRTIATAKYFTAGLFPTANIDVEYHVKFDTMDPVFTPQLTFISEEYIKDATEEVFRLYKDKIEGLKDNYELLEDVLEIQDSAYAKENNFQGFNTDDTELLLKPGEEPVVSGSLKTATGITDALVLQYYEESDAKKAAFGKELSNEQWAQISEIKDVYGDVLFTAPLIATNVAYPLLKEIKSEMDASGERRFTFLCGHDSNVGSVLAALGAENYDLPNAIEKKTPIGCKLVFSKWKSASGREYWSIDFVYQNVEQLRTQPILGLENTPEVYHISIKGLKQNKDGLYKDKKVRKLFNKLLNEYDVLYTKYADKAT